MPYILISIHKMLFKWTHTRNRLVMSQFYPVNIQSCAPHQQRATYIPYS